jgi:hypothetical protein
MIFHPLWRFVASASHLQEEKKCKTLALQIRLTLEVGRVEVQVVLSVWVATALNAKHHRVHIPVCVGALSLGAPTRGARWHAACGYRAAIELACRDAAASEKTQTCMVEVVVVEFVHVDLRAAGREEGLEPLVLHEH